MIFRRKPKRAKPPWRKCELSYCECRDYTTYEQLPDNIRYLIHERDWHHSFQTARARRAEDLLDDEIEYLIRDNPRMQTPEDLAEAQHRTREHWADKISQIPYDEDYRVPSPNSMPLRAPGALR